MVTEELQRKGRRRRWLIDYPRGIPVLIFVLVTAITVLSVFSIERGEVERDAADVSRKAQAMTSAIERRAYTSSAYLRAGAALFSTQADVTPAVFRRFVSELRLDSNYRGAEGIGWAPVVAASQLRSFEGRLNAERISDKTVRPTLQEQPREILTPILYMQPDTARNRRALGYDMYSQPVRRTAMDLAAANDRPTASGPVVLVQEGGGDAAGFLIYMPVFEGLSMARNLKGFIFSPFNASQFLGSAANLVSYESVGARLRDGEAQGEPILAQSDGWIDGRSAVTREVSLANRRMLLEVQSTRVEGLSSMSMITLLFGLAVASLLMLVSRLLTQQTLEDRRAIIWFEEQNSIRNSLTRELNHRVKNTLANVLSIVSLTRRRSGSLDEFAEGLDGRIRALSATHDLLTQSEWGTTPIRSVVDVELAPYARDEEQKLELVGPHTELAPND
ncbi:MAG TPA: histidine kinase, partial [Erythrobacter sp.]|nr:histidine kinase [Erythrobacter sp.]